MVHYSYRLINALRSANVYGQWYLLIALICITLSSLFIGHLHFLFYKLSSYVLPHLKFDLVLSYQSVGALCVLEH